MRGFGGVLSFMLKGNDFDSVRRFLPRLQYAHAAANLGSVETIVGPPATTSHVECTAKEREAMGIPESLIRYSVGIEDTDDLIAGLGISVIKRRSLALCIGQVTAFCPLIIIAISFCRIRLLLRCIQLRYTLSRHKANPKKSGSAQQLPIMHHRPDTQAVVLSRVSPQFLSSPYKEDIVLLSYLHPKNINRFFDLIVFV
jgi:hypothetical protein